MKKININENELNNIKKMHLTRCLKLCTTYCKKIKEQLNNNDDIDLSQLYKILPKNLEINISENNKIEILRHLSQKIETFLKDITEHADMLFINNPFDTNMEINPHYNEIFKNKNDDFGILNHSYKIFRNYRKREWCASKYIKKINVITCPYCGQSYISFVQKRNGDIILEGDLDHYYPKSKYWYLTLNLYNLIPICKTCNSTYKGDNDSHVINPYIESIDDKITFEFKNIDNYILRNEDVIVNIKKKEPNNINLTNHIEILELKNRYEFYQNIIKSIIKKRHKYNDNYLEQIAKLTKYDKKIIETNIIKQDILSDDEPFLKFKIDLWKQIS